MLAIELPSELRITTKKTEDTICCAGFLFKIWGYKDAESQAYQANIVRCFDDRGSPAKCKPRCDC